MEEDVEAVVGAVLPEVVVVALWVVVAPLEVAPLDPGAVYDASALPLGAAPVHACCDAKYDE